MILFFYLTGVECIFRFYSIGVKPIPLLADPISHGEKNHEKQSYESLCVFCALCA